MSSLLFSAHCGELFYNVWRMPPGGMNKLYINDNLAKFVR